MASVALVAGTLLGSADTAQAAGSCPVMLVGGVGPQRHEQGTVPPATHVQIRTATRPGLRGGGHSASPPARR